MKEARPNSPAALKFLKAMFPKGPWLLVSIDPEDRAKLDAATFGPNTIKELQAFLKAHNGQHNIYFHVNPVMKPMTKKARREDIKEVIQFHVDVDPRPGEDIDVEQKRALKLLTEDRPKAIPEPTWIVFSGGGFQAFWRLKQAIPINGDIAAAEDAKRYNQTLEGVFKADHCHNIDRLMRLPGTVNIPDAKKRQKGRVPALSTVVMSNPKNTYALKSFTPAKEVQGTGTNHAGHQVNVDQGNIERVSIEDLKTNYDIPDKFLEVIVQGESPREEWVKERADNGTDNSRSGWLFVAVSAMVRADVPDQTIYAVITDPTLAISDSVLMARSGKKLSANAAHNYAVRQIERCKDFNVDPALEEMNQRHAVIGNVGGKCTVIEEQWDENLKRQWLTFQSFGDVKNRYNNQRVEVGKDKSGEAVYMQKGNWWLMQQKRRQYDTITFSPDRDTPNAYNLWQGWAYPALPGEKHEGYLHHIRENICSGNEANYQYLIRWMARTVQLPAENGQVAVVLRGDRGVGKSQFVHHFGQLFGRHYIQLANSAHLVGHFNQHLRDVLLLFGDEAFFAGDKKHESVLKVLVTEKSMMFEKKGHDAVLGPNYIRLILASNSDWVVPAGPFERRFFVLDVGSSKRQDSKYFGSITEDMRNGGYESLLAFLLGLNLEGWSVYDFPRTKALQEQQTNSLSVEEQWLLSKLEGGCVFDSEDHWPFQSYAKAVYFDYHRWASAARGAGIRVLTENGFGRWLKTMVPGLERLQDTGKPVTLIGLHGEEHSIANPMVIYWPAVKALRARWDDRYGGRDWSVKVVTNKGDTTDTMPF